MSDEIRKRAAGRLGKVYQLVRYAEMCQFRHTATDDVPAALKEAREELDAAIKELGDWFEAHDKVRKGEQG